MSGSGSPDLSAADATGLDVAIVASSWHTEVMDGLINGATTALDEFGAPEPAVVRVPGSFELPLVVRECAEAGYDAVVALGVVVRGGTPHFEYVCRAATDGLSRVALETRTPVGFGLLTCDDEVQARARAGLAGSTEDKGREAAEAAIVTARVLRRVRSSRATAG